MTPIPRREASPGTTRATTSNTTTIPASQQIRYRHDTAC